MRSNSHKTKVGVALLAAAALALAPALLASSGAHAADRNIGPDDVAPYENGDETLLVDGYNYDQWHVGSTTLTDANIEDSFLFGDCGVTAVNPGNDWSDWPQMLKGYPIDARPSTPDAIRDIILGASLDVESGLATLQFPMFSWDIDDTGERIDESLRFVTAHNTPSGPGLISVTGESDAAYSGVHESPDVFQGLFDEMEEAASTRGVEFELLGVGFNASVAENTAVNSLTFGGDTFYFGTGDCVPVDEPVEEDPTTPTPPDKVDTAAGATVDAGAIFLMGGLLLTVAGVTAARVVGARRSSKE